MPSIQGWFSKFGEVTNVAIEPKTKRALVSFTTNREAYTAWRSDDAVFGSRHVKVMWHRPRPGQGGQGQEMLDASAELVSNLKQMKGANGATNGVSNGSAILTGPESRLRATLAELEANERRNKRETLIAEQKVLLKRAESGTKEEKLEILKRLREVSKQMEELDKPVGDIEMSDKDPAGQGAGEARDGDAERSRRGGITPS